ncbi:MAG TPA: anti-sigma factor [Verrucomicrobiae bacterium]|nr:anti-sigma factor [Verrucomicrobiae bacterium]
MKPHLTQEQLIDYLHGELAPGEDAGVLLHLEGCDPCRAQYEEEATLTESLRSFARTSERELPAGVRASILSAVEASQSQPGWTARITGWLRPAVAIPVAAAIAIAVFAGYGSAVHSGRTTIDAAYYLDDHAALTSAVPFNEGNTVPTALLTTENADGSQ